MPVPLRVSQGLDLVAVVENTATTTSTAYAFTPKDGPPAPTGKTTAIVAEEVIIENRDSVNDLIVRLASTSNEAVSAGFSGGTTGASAAQNAPQQQQILVVDTTKFPAAVAGDIRVPKGTTITLHARAVGFTVISSASTVNFTIIGVGSNVLAA